MDAFAAAGHTEPAAAADHFALLRDGAIVRGYLSDPVAAVEMLLRGTEGMIRVSCNNGPATVEKETP